MAQVVSYDPAKLPSPVAAPSKYDADLLRRYVELIGKGKAAGDGETYENAKAARGAANSIKRAIKKHVDDQLSLVMRVWQDEAGFHFALTENTRPLTGAAAAAAAQS